MTQQPASNADVVERDNEDDDSEAGDELDDWAFVRKAIKKADDLEDNRAEYSTVDYTPCTNIRPVDLTVKLRSTKAGRTIRLAAVVTGYNEDGDELRRTLTGIAANLSTAHKAGLHWSEVCVFVIMDGRERISASMVDYVSTELQVLDLSLLKSEHRGHPVTMHLFERTIELSKSRSQREYYLPMQLVFALKEKNGGKLNSHLWYMSGFCGQINPKYCMLLDVGTVPRAAAITNLYAAMEDDPQCGGAAGEICVRNVRPWLILDAVQSFEYAISHLLDKATESLFGYIPVLPGAFSIYRWVAIRGDPLAAYFTIEEIPVKELGAFTANMYLAEDRILCFEIVGRPNRRWLLKYVSTALADTDTPETLLELIKQRRRWLNGSFFALLYYLKHFPKFLRTRHGPFRKLGFGFQFFTQAFTAAFSWFGVANLFLTLLLIFSQAFDQSPGAARELKALFVFVYVGLLFVQLVFSIVGNIARAAHVFVIISVLYGLLMMFSFSFSIWLVVTSFDNLETMKFTSFVFVILGLVASVMGYFFAALIHGRLLSIASVFLQYCSFLPTMVNMFTCYSVCNTHDISWGTKEGNVSTLTLAASEAKAKRAAARAAATKDRLDRLQRGEDVPAMTSPGGRSGTLEGTGAPSRVDRSTGGPGATSRSNATVGDPSTPQHHIGTAALLQRQHQQQQRGFRSSVASLRSDGSAPTRACMTPVGDGIPPRGPVPLGRAGPAQDDTEPPYDADSDSGAGGRSSPYPRSRTPARNTVASPGGGNTSAHPQRAGRGSSASISTPSVSLQQPLRVQHRARGSSQWEDRAGGGAGAVGDPAVTETTAYQLQLQQQQQRERVTGQISEVYSERGGGPSPTQHMRNASLGAGRTSYSSAGTTPAHGRSVTTGGAADDNTLIYGGGGTMPLDARIMMPGVVRGPSGLPATSQPTQPLGPVFGTSRRHSDSDTQGRPFVSPPDTTTVGESGPWSSGASAQRTNPSGSRVPASGPLSAASPVIIGRHNSAWSMGPRPLPHPQLQALSEEGDTVQKSAARSSAATSAPTQMKFIGADDGVAAYVTYDANMRDIGLAMDLSEHANAAKVLSSADPAAVRREMIVRVKRQQATQEEAATIAKRKADELVADRKHMAEEFNSFRMRMVLSWVLSNAFIVAVVLTFDPELLTYGSVVTATVIFQIFTKLAGTTMYQVARVVRAFMRSYCLACCYRVEYDPTDRPRVVCACRTRAYYSLDDMWESEHPYEHAYPDDPLAAASGEGRSGGRSAGDGSGSPRGEEEYSDEVGMDAASSHGSPEPDSPHHGDRGSVVRGHASLSRGRQDSIRSGRASHRSLALDSDGRAGPPTDAHAEPSFEEGSDDDEDHRLAMRAQTAAAAESGSSPPRRKKMVVPPPKERRRKSIFGIIPLPSAAEPPPMPSLAARRRNSVVLTSPRPGAPSLGAPARSSRTLGRRESNRNTAATSSGSGSGSGSGSSSGRNAAEAQLGGVVVVGGSPPSPAWQPPPVPRSTSPSLATSGESGRDPEGGTNWPYNGPPPALGRAAGDGGADYVQLAVGVHTSRSSANSDDRITVLPGAAAPIDVVHFMSAPRAGSAGAGGRGTAQFGNTPPSRRHLQVAVAGVQSPGVAPSDRTTHHAAGSFVSSNGGPGTATGAAYGALGASASVPVLPASDAELSGQGDLALHRASSFLAAASSAPGQVVRGNSIQVRQYAAPAHEEDPPLGFANYENGTREARPLRPTGLPGFRRPSQGSLLAAPVPAAVAVHPHPLQGDAVQRYPPAAGPQLHPRPQEYFGSPHPLVRGNPSGIEPDDGARAPRRSSADDLGYHHNGLLGVSPGLGPETDAGGNAPRRRSAEPVLQPALLPGQPHATADDSHDSSATATGLSRSAARRLGMKRASLEEEMAGKLNAALLPIALSNPLSPFQQSMPAPDHQLIGRAFGTPLRYASAAASAASSAASAAVVSAEAGRGVAAQQPRQQQQQPPNSRSPGVANSVLRGAAMGSLALS